MRRLVKKTSLIKGSSQGTVIRVFWALGAFSFLWSSYVLAGPAVVVGDTEALVPLAYTSYFEDQPVLFFTSQLSSPQISELLEKTKSVIVVNNQLQRYRKEVGDFLNNPAVDVAYLFFRERNEEHLRERSFYLPRESRWRIKARIVVDLAQVKKDTALNIKIDSLQKVKKWSFDSENVEYDYFISDQGTLSVNVYFDGGLIPSSKGIRETENEYLKLTIPDLDYDVDEYPFLDLIYQTQDPTIQQIDGELGIDLTGDGKVDETIFLRKEIILEDWIRGYPVTPATDLYETRLLEGWPEAYNTEGPSADKFTIYKNGMPMQTTWCKWDNYREQAEIGVWAHNRVVITVPKGESPQESLYAVSYLPSVTESKEFPGFSKLKVNIKKAVEAIIGKTKKPRLRSISLYLQKTSGIDSSTPDNKGVYSFNIKGLKIYRTATVEEMLGGDNRWLKKTPLFKVAGKNYSLEDMDKVMSDTDSLWCEIENLKLRKGSYQFSAMPHENLELELALLEPISSQESAKSQKEKVAVKFRKVRATRYRVQAEAKDSFWLVFNESFDPGWKAFIRKGKPKTQRPTAKKSEPLEWSALLSSLWDWGKRTEIKEHYPVNGYANAWWVPVREFQANTKELGQEFNPLKLEIIVEYGPQRWLEVRMAVFLIVLVGCIGYFGLRFRRKKKRS